MLSKTCKRVVSDYEFVLERTILQEIRAVELVTVHQTVCDHGCPCRAFVPSIH